MFTGIVAAVGQIVAVVALNESVSQAGLRLRIAAADLGLGDVALGDSIAIQGACMTVTELAGNEFTIEISRESLSKTVGLDCPGEVNLEKALRLSDRLGGHLVSGHVDGLGRVVRFDPVGESRLLVVRCERSIARYLVYKGSITVNGVSLTVNQVHDDADGCEFSVNLIAHTLSATTLRLLRVGSQVNLEIDLIARYVERMNSLDSAKAP